MKWPWKRPPQRRADPLAIAVLEYELLGIEPAPGSAAEFAIRLRRAFGPHRDQDIDRLVAHYERATEGVEVARSDHR
ncbi:hypothetical protein ACFXI6_14245 [Streptomyces mirabilis]|uniref:hypothetical protein n=1 Tax=Streptomyces mirabilis TaxID=68239 RepID=UPI0036C384E6